jgi:xanthine/CO dehydrogenase XdhC/CoxF family maturation factor
MVEGSVSAGASRRHRRPVRRWPDGALRRRDLRSTADEARRFGLPCGGTIQLVLGHDAESGIRALLSRSKGQARPGA